MEPRVLAIPLVAALIGGALCWALARWVAAWLGWVVCALLLGGAVALLVTAQARSGFDGLGYFVLAVLALAPAGLGAALGAVIATAQARKRVNPPPGRPGQG